MLCACMSVRPHHHTKFSQHAWCQSSFASHSLTVHGACPPCLSQPYRTMVPVLLAYHSLIVPWCLSSFASHSLTVPWCLSSFALLYHGGVVLFLHHPHAVTTHLQSLYYMWLLIFKVILLSIYNYPYSFT